METVAGMQVLGKRGCPVVISPRVVSPNATDFSSLRALFASQRLAGKQGQELAVAIWELIVDEHEGLYHSCPPLERLTDHFVWDPVKLFNAFGWSICGLTANLMAVLYKAAGFADARVANLKGHEATEVFYDGGWHFLDGDLQAYHRRHPPHADEIASYAECVADPTLVSRQQNPSSPYYLPDRPPDAMAKLYEVEPSHDLAFAEHAHTMDFVLRPGESLERSTFGEGKWIWFSNYTDFKARWPTEWRDDGPWERFPPHRRFGNGRWVYEPNLKAGFRDFELGALATDGIGPGEAGATAMRAGQCSCVFEANSPYPFTGTPAREGTERPREGCIVEAVVAQEAEASTRIEMAVDPDLPWFPVWESRGEGFHDVRLDLTEYAANAYRCLLRFVFEAPRPGACTLRRLRVESSIMVAPASLGRLVGGENPLTIVFGDEYGVPTRRWMVETNFRDEADLRRKAHRVENLRFVDTEDRILPADAGSDYEVVFRIEAPVHGVLRRLYAFGSYRGKAPDDPAEDRVAASVAASEDGPWRPIFESPVLVERHRWHFSAQGEAELESPAKVAFVKFTGKVGMNAARVRASWTDERLAGLRAPLFITHTWREADGAEREHTEQVASANAPHRYSITCGEEPELRSIRMHVPSLPVEG